MRSLYRSGTSRDRAIKSHQITQLVQMQRRKMAAADTHERIRDFEDHLRQLRDPTPEAEDDLPLNATASNMKTEKTIIIPDAASDSSDSPRTPHAQKMDRLRKSSSDSFINREVAGRPHMLDDTDDHLHARRPPSPLAFYDYGNISMKPKSVMTQHQQQRNHGSNTGGAKSARRASSSSGFYFPGPDYRQGPYGFSMQDPILMPPRFWENQRAPQRSDQHANNQRPRHVRGAGNDGGVKQAFLSKPTVPTGVRSTRGQELKLQRVFGKLDNDQEEAGLEQTRYEEGNFGGRWCHPVVCRHSNYVSDGPIEHPVNNWMEQDLENSSEGALLAHRILAGITHALQDRHSTLSRLFWAVNQGCPGVLELEEFIEGLVRLQILEGDEVVTLKVLSEAMSLIDPDFDGCVNYPALTRAISAAQAVQRQQKQFRAEAGHQVQKAAATNNYGAALPVEVVKVDKNSKSVYDFNRSMGMFTKQQRALLSHHGERVDSM